MKEDTIRSMKLRVGRQWGISVFVLFGLACLMAGEEPATPSPKQIEDQIKALDRQIDQRDRQMAETLRPLKQYFVCGNYFVECQRALDSAKAQIEEARKAGKTDDLAKAQQALKEAQSRDKELKAWAKENEKAFRAELKKMGRKVDDQANAADEFGKILSEFTDKLTDLRAKRDRLESAAKH